MVSKRTLNVFDFALQIYHLRLFLWVRVFANSLRIKKAQISPFGIKINLKMFLLCFYKKFEREIRKLRKEKTL